MITIDVKYTLICLVLLALLVLLVYLAILAKNLITTVKSANKVVEDAAVVSGIASDKATQLDDIVGDVSGAVEDITKAMKGNQSLIGALTNMAKAIASAISYIKKGSDQDDAESTEPKSRQRRRNR
ncbi:hypothetical protein [Aminicella lysinilytica]|mgnify:CR=1 FL=1|jgi:methyl-accepting chemotaxis protein|uniref:DUF948 domain-containing protein n=1 Tax=Aminicella lysinilytica TaxID=433323 RepID=A0A4R6PY78_9FIRM|nr:hypothetical protein [Aminicella lysinilytica]TDP50373.1 hypothetical protein EV211_1378 [Aminicella lysinilytica]